jgi:hypothetical protein
MCHNCISSILLCQYCCSHRFLLNTILVLYCLKWFCILVLLMTAFTQDGHTILLPLVLYWFCRACCYIGGWLSHSRLQFFLSSTQGPVNLFGIWPSHKITPVHSGEFSKHLIHLTVYFWVTVGFFPRSRSSFVKDARFVEYVTTRFGMYETGKFMLMILLSCYLYSMSLTTLCACLSDMVLRYN